MKLTDNTIRCEKMLALLLLGAALWVSGGCSDSTPVKPVPAKPLVKAAAKTNLVQLVQTNDDSLLTNAVFDNDGATGRDPFYPSSTRNGQGKVAGMEPKPRVEPVLVLNSILGAGSRRCAGINNRTFSVGETASVQVASGGSVRVHCLEIADRSVVVTIEGESEPKILKLTQ